MPTRDSSLIDVLANAIGSLLGVAADRRWGTPAAGRLARVRAATSSAVLAGVVGGFLIVALLLSATLQARTRLSNWNPEYPLLIGNEHTGDRPWRGRVFALDITDAATPAASVRRFSAGESVVMPGTRIAAFDFDGGPPYKDASGNLPDLEWTERPERTKARRRLVDRRSLAARGPDLLQLWRSGCGRRTRSPFVSGAPPTTPTRTGRRGLSRIP